MCFKCSTRIQGCILCTEAIKQGHVNNRSFDDSFLSTYKVKDWAIAVAVPATQGFLHETVHFCVSTCYCWIYNVTWQCFCVSSIIVLHWVWLVYTCAEMPDTHVTFGCTYNNEVLACHFYQDKFPSCPVPDKHFQTLIIALWKEGHSFFQKQNKENMEHSRSVLEESSHW